MSYELIDTDKLDSLNKEMEAIKTMLSTILTSQNSANSQPILYTNKTIIEKLGVNEKTLKKYRDDGLLAFTKVNDKYWYSQNDVDEFIYHNHFKAYAYPN